MNGKNSSGSLQHGRGARELMKPSEVRRMSRKKCTIFMEGQDPIFDDKALPFQTPNFLHAMELNKNGGYVHPVKTVYNKETMRYRTIVERD